MILTIRALLPMLAIVVLLSSARGDVNNGLKFSFVRYIRCIDANQQVNDCFKFSIDPEALIELQLGLDVPARAEFLEFRAVPPYQAVGLPEVLGPTNGRFRLEDVRVELPPGQVPDSPIVAEVLFVDTLAGVGPNPASERFTARLNPGDFAVFQDLELQTETRLSFSEVAPVSLYAPVDFDGDGILNGATDIDLLTAEINSPEPSLFFDLTQDGLVDEADRQFYILENMRTYFGDSNLDGQFIAEGPNNDFDLVFSSGEFEDDIVGNSTWATGDWNGDGDFDSGDFLFALENQFGRFPSPPRAPNTNLPEPASPLAFILAAGVLLRCRRVRVRRNDRLKMAA